MLRIPSSLNKVSAVFGFCLFLALLLPLQMAFAQTAAPTAAQKAAGEAYVQKIIAYDKGPGGAPLPAGTTRSGTDNNRIYTQKNSDGSSYVTTCETTVIPNGDSASSNKHCSGVLIDAKGNTTQLNGADDSVIDSSLTGGVDQTTDAKRTPPFLLLMQSRVFF